MRLVKPEKLEWQGSEGCLRAEVHTDTGMRLEMLEVPPETNLAPHHHKKRREFLCVTLAGGAQIRIGERVFRPTAGQIFEREPGEVMEIVNDTKHPLRILITQMGYDAADVHAG